MSLRMISLVFRGGPKIAFFKWPKCSILQLCNNYCSLIEPYSCNEKELLLAYVYSFSSKINTILCKPGRHPIQPTSPSSIWRRETFRRHFFRKDKWPSSSPDCNPLNHYFRDAVTKRYTRVIRNVFRVLLSWKNEFEKFGKMPMAL